MARTTKTQLAAEHLLSYGVDVTKVRYAGEPESDDALSPRDTRRASADLNVLCCAGADTLIKGGYRFAFDEYWRIGVEARGGLLREVRAIEREVRTLQGNPSLDDRIEEEEELLQKAGVEVHVCNEALSRAVALAMTRKVRVLIQRWLNVK